MLIIGIDPGISGSICFFENGKILEVVEMPTMTDGKKNKRQVNGAQIYNEILKRINKDNEQNVRPIDIDLYYLISDTNTLKRLNNNESFSPLLDYNELIGMFITLYITTKTRERIKGIFIEHI